MRGTQKNIKFKEVCEIFCGGNKPKQNSDTLYFSQIYTLPLAYETKNFFNMSAAFFCVLSRSCAINLKINPIYA